MCRKLSIILLLCVVVFAPSIASVQGDIWSKQKIAIEEIVDKTERGLDKDYKNTIYANLRNILANNNYNAFEVNRNDVINQLKTKNQDITLPNIYKEIGEMGADFIIRTEIRATSSAYDAQNANAKIIIVLSQHRIATGKEVSRTEMVDPYQAEITNAIIRLTSQLFGIPISEASRQTSSSYQPSLSYGSQSNYGSSNSSLYQRPSYQQQSSSYQSQSNYGSSNSSSYSRSTQSTSSQSHTQNAEDRYLNLAREGNAEAQYKLGGCYELGLQGVRKQYQNAFYWYKRAAEQGHTNAQYRLGFCYEYGIGVANNFDYAVSWYRKAARNGSKAAEARLRQIYKY